MAEILKPVFERTSKGTRMMSSPDNVTSTAFAPRLTTFRLPGWTERVTVSLTVAFIVTELWAITLAGTKTPTAMSVSRNLICENS